MFIFTIGSVIAGSATSSNMLIGGRAVQGVGAAGMVNGAFTTIASSAPENQKPSQYLFFQGQREPCLTNFFLSSVYWTRYGFSYGWSSHRTYDRRCLDTGRLMALVYDTSHARVSGVEFADRQTGFYINLPPAGVVLLVLMIIKIPEQTEKKPVRSNWKHIVTSELDLIGFGLFAPASVMLLLAVIWGGNQFAWDSSTIIGLFCGSFVTYIIFAGWQIHRGEKAMIPPQIIRKKLVLTGCATNFLVMASNLSLAYYLPLWFQVVKDASPTMSGVDLLPTAIAQSLGALTAGKFGGFDDRMSASV